MSKLKFTRLLRRLYGWRSGDLEITFMTHDIRLAWPDLHGLTMERAIPYTQMSTETLREFSVLFRMTTRS